MYTAVVDERLLNARGAYSSAATQALLVLTVLGIVVLSQQSIDLGRVVDWGRGFQALLCVGALGYLVATWHQPRPRVALAISIILLLPIFPLVAWATVRWYELGRPWEAFPVLQVAIMGIALIVPRSFWLGVAFVLMFALEALGIVVWFRHMGVSRSDIPGTEPYFSFILAIASIGLLRMREQRRDARQRYLAAQGETLMLEGLTSTMDEIRARFETATRALMAGVEKLAHEQERQGVVTRMSDALNRLGALNERLDALDAKRPGAQMSSATRAVDDEKRFIAQDAHDSALLLAVMELSSAVITVVALQGLPVGLGGVFYAALGLLAGGCLVFLLATRSRPSRPRATIAFLLMFLPLFGIVGFMQVQWARMAAPFELFMGFKVVMAIIPLVVPRSRWLGFTLVTLIGIEAIVLYEVLDFSSQKHRVAFAEPWITVVYCVLGVMLIVLHDERRSASVQLLRAEADLKALTRRSRLLLAILDETGSPLQVLALSLALLKTRDPASSLVPEMEKAIDEFALARKTMTERLSITEWHAGFDAARELTSLSAPPPSGDDVRGQSRSVRALG